MQTLQDVLERRQIAIYFGAVSMAVRSTDVATATRLLQDLARRLDTGHRSAAASVREGLEETLTLVALGLSEALRRSFSTTNAVESLISRTRHVTRHVKRWRGGRRSVTPKRFSTRLGTHPRFHRTGTLRQNRGDRRFMEDICEGYVRRIRSN